MCDHTIAAHEGNVFGGSCQNMIDLICEFDYYVHVVNPKGDVDYRTETQQILQDQPGQLEVFAETSYCHSWMRGSETLKGMQRADKGLFEVTIWGMAAVESIHEDLNVSGESYVAVPIATIS